MAPTTKSPSKPKSSGQDPWEDRHTRILAQGVLELVKTHRKDLYKLRGLAGEVDGHGGDRIRSKLDIMMKRLVKENGGTVAGRSSPSKGKKAATMEVDELNED